MSLKYRRLGDTDIAVSVVGLGTHQFGGAWGYEYSQCEVDLVLGEARDLGINLLDTAASYGPHLSESFIGESLGSHREDWIVATKYGREWTKGHGTNSTFDLASVEKQLHASLRALKTDYIDLYQFHSGTNAEYDNDELWSFLQKQVELGKIRHLGISVSGPLSNANDTFQTEYARDVNAKVIQVVYNRMNENAADSILPLCESMNLGVLARIPLAKGFLSGKYSPDTNFPSDDHRSEYDPSFNQKLLEEAARIKHEEVPEGMEMSQWAIAWCLQHPAVSAVIPGAKNQQQLKSNAKAADLGMVSMDHRLAEYQKGDEA